MKALLCGIVLGLGIIGGMLLIAPWIGNAMTIYYTWVDQVMGVKR